MKEIMKERTVSLTYNSTHVLLCYDVELGAYVGLSEGLRFWRDRARHSRHPLRWQR